MKNKLEEILAKHYGGEISKEAVSDIINLFQQKPTKELFNQLKTLYLGFYKEMKGEEYYWSAKDSGTVKHIVNKIRFKIKERQMEETDELVIRSFEAILGRIQDRWILENLSLPLINSKFNEIIAKNGQNTTSELGRLIANKY